ncbi:hypothetical protein [Bradyrhizobium japonicum]|uniref:hypothetical protein n=1 Tax=Bradyrhizobium japonicum TaxID=375 RepID=UPI0020A09F2F|nr:hypothetical protein [Bradyrhizobium japonicum]MCP1765533.1 hypothetical protein [Bradyrhizobium japonicum]MCP1787670.1 hypothetical protein [Bradyrhizobium japonicum]MCP1809546.1 hypothetical protein [Bradyrhizobium japonicum]MCP1818480.1 hypothetical protein [Bradyrhizobium japonicum]MCP1870010.1 hypothetical protein [Bradyrhizobium japonicum]
MRVNKITWDKIGRATEPGRYKCFFGHLIVTPDDIEVWTHYPDATFTLITERADGQSAAEEYRRRRSPPWVNVCALIWATISRF